MGVEDDEIEALLTKKGMVKTAMRELDYLEKPRTKRNVAISVKGQIIKARFLRQTPALAELIKSIKETHKNLGILEAIDGGKMTVRSAHSALNTLLQSCGSILVKYATVILYDNLSTSGWVWGKDWALVAHIHDELQMYCKKERADELGILAVEAIAEAGRRLNLRCPLDGEYKTGANWAETH